MKIKFNLGWILAVAAALVLAGMGFMSFYYLNSGKALWGIIVAACLLVIPIIVCMQLAKDKGCSKPFYFHRAAVNELTMLIVMFVVLVGAMAAINHFFTVNGRTEQIREVVDDQNEQIGKMINDYNAYVERRVSNYEETLKTLEANREGNEKTYEKMFDTSSVNTMVDILRAEITPDPDIDNSKLEIMGNKTRWWKLPTTMNNVDIITTALQETHDNLVKCSQNDSTDIIKLREYSNEYPNLGITIPEYWSYSYSSASDIMHYFTDTKGFISNIWAVVSGLVGILLVMLPYFVTDRDSRSKGLLKELRKKEEEDELEVNGNIGTV